MKQANFSAHFDTSKYAQCLMASGMPKRQAEDQAKLQSQVFKELIDDTLATKTDFSYLEDKINISVSHLGDKIETPASHLEDKINTAILHSEERTHDSISRLSEKTELSFHLLGASLQQLEENTQQMEERLTDRIDKVYYRVVFTLGSVIVTSVGVLSVFKSI